MGNSVLKIENVSKIYRLGQISGSSFLKSIFSRNKNLINSGQHEGLAKDPNVLYALNNVNAEIYKGDVVGIIGKNGAGKSTLLKILSRVTTPTEGIIKYNGRIAALLEVATGFHPDLTGRENIYLNGAILGMKKNEITSKLDEIIAFSGVEKFIDTPVKRYSSGMKVRLGFAVAAHLQSDILIVDEVLAVGDAEFQKKCLGKMENISKSEGRTVLFVSHNMSVVNSLCSRGIVLSGGSVIFDGKVSDAVDNYINQNAKRAQYVNPNQDGINSFRKIEILNKFGEPSTNQQFDHEINVSIELHAQVMNGTHVSFSLYDSKQNIVLSTLTPINPTINGIKKFVATIPARTLMPGSYYLNFNMHIPNVEIFDSCSDHLFLHVEDTGSEFSMFNLTKFGSVYVPIEWKTP